MRVWAVTQYLARSRFLDSDPTLVSTVHRLVCFPLHHSVFKQFRRACRQNPTFAPRAPARIASHCYPCSIGPHSLGRGEQHHCRSRTLDKDEDMYCICTLRPPTLRPLGTSHDDPNQARFARRFQQTSGMECRTWAAASNVPDPVRPRVIARPSFDYLAVITHLPSYLAWICRPPNGHSFALRGTSRTTGQTGQTAAFDVLSLFPFHSLFAAPFFVSARSSLPRARPPARIPFPPPFVLDRPFLLIIAPSSAPLSPSSARDGQATHEPF